MAVIHQTSMSPGKLELLASWLPTRTWYHASGRPPHLSKAGGFRLDDPAGEVGIEFMVIADSSGVEPAVYLVPLTYRGGPLENAEDGLVGTSLHGVLGQRWIYDGAHDPVLVAQLIAMLAGKAQPQAQNNSDTTDLSVIVAAADIVSQAVESASVVDGADSTDIATQDGVILRVERFLRSGGVSQSPHVTAPWRLPDGTDTRGIILTARM
ncbi:maltokinase N-terminal cap-like domain-containing protein [Nocardia sp. NBC_01009]|uniref:maltokinase N-terminal cap-like domain-containing protein n=1 Tax=Nocardia sp. NBC_01009 TaxID=2975996 RepID=UPI0038642276|nr:1,4-alpha-glucan branching protein [Nocardia sp. NBC_01009]